jgi:hypothetical protein
MNQDQNHLATVILMVEEHNARILEGFSEQIKQSACSTRNISAMLTPAHLPSQISRRVLDSCNQTLPFNFVEEKFCIAYMKNLTAKEELKERF